MKSRLFIALAILSATVTMRATAEGKMVTVHVNGMVCQLCSQGIKTKLEGHAAVQGVHVDMDKKEVHVSLKDGKAITDAEITELIKDGGSNVAKIVR